MNTPTNFVAQSLGIAEKQVAATARLLGDGATIPFIARYRKEATGGLDEVQIGNIRDGLERLEKLNERRAAMLKSLTERDLLTPALQQSLEDAATLVKLEDLYLPFRPKRRTRAAAAREKGLEPLARWLMTNTQGDPAAEAARYVSADKGLADAAAALAGARDIIAETFAENPRIRGRARQMFAVKALAQAKVVAGKEEAGAKYRDYFAWSEPAGAASSHRLLALFRAEAEGIVRLSLRPDEAETCQTLAGGMGGGNSPVACQVWAALQDGYKRLLAPSMENELRATLKKKADAEAIRIFGENLRQLLLAPPLGAKTILALDPGFRTGCKLVCLNRQGDLLAHAVIQPHAGSARAAEEAAETLRRMVQTHAVEAIAIGNGTAGRETELFVRDVAAQAGWPPLPIIMVSESGASVYSASEIAREEFPQLDLTYRGAVSIGRRLADPLAELVKIDPRSIGVGQYQHDVDQGELQRRLAEVVSSCVNLVGVNVNTASAHLLAYVSGISGEVARNIVAWRRENGPFRTRRQLMKVPRLGPKAFEQAAGFLRIPEGEHPLDASAVHPESYAVVERMAQDAGCAVRDLLRHAALRSRIDVRRYITERIGMATLQDILAELEKPGRDPRPAFHVFQFAEGVHSMEDVRPGMTLPGIVTNITAFGAFIDIGVHQDGLAHVSKLADRFIRDPAEAVSLGMEVMATVLEVDQARKRISLSLVG